jgi:hypothetical protein
MMARMRRWMPAGTNASQGRITYGPPFLSSLFEDASALHPDESALGLLGVVTREQLDEFVFVDPYLLDRPVREIEHDVEDFQLVVRPRT